MLKEWFLQKTAAKIGIRNKWKIPALLIFIKKRSRHETSFMARRRVIFLLRYWSYWNSLKKLMTVYFIRNGRPLI